MATLTDYQLPPDVNQTSDIKTHIKHTFVRLLWTLFSAESDFLNKIETGLAFTADSSEDGLHVFTRFPNIRRELPSIVVSLRGLSGTRKTLNKNLNTAFNDNLLMNQLPAPDDAEHHRQIQGFDVSGFVQFDMMALNDSTRDALIDKLVDFFIWRGENAAGLDSRTELQNRWIHIDVDNYGLSGDQEIPLEEGTGDLVYTDGLAIPFIAELYHFDHDQVPLERIKLEIDTEGLG